MYLFILLLLIKVYIHGYGGEGGHTVRKMETDVEEGCEGEGGYRRKGRRESPRFKNQVI